jgi:hypothetical protein
MYVIATAIKTTTEALTWELLQAGDFRPASAQMADKRRNFASRNRKVRLFTERQWDDLPTGHRSDDWVVLSDRRIPAVREQAGA